MFNPFRPSLPRPQLRTILLAGLGGFLAIALLAFFTEAASLPLLMAPFGATCVLLFAAPSAPLSQPLNVIGGHLVATAVGLVLNGLLPDSWWALALAVGCAIALMVALRVTHPPAGADPLVVFAANPGVAFLLTPVLLGSIILVLAAIAYHRASGGSYPARSR